MALRNASWVAASRLTTSGSTIFSVTDVFDRAAGSSAKKSIHGVVAAQSASTLKFKSARAMRPLRPPSPFAQVSVSR
jgi:hypothetical protein